MIQLKNVSKSFGNQTVLQDVNMTLTEGKVIGIVGENGAGKTTLFRCIAGLESFDGTITSDCTPLKNHLGFLMTDPFFFSKITGEEYIRLLCNAREIELEELERKNVFDLPLKQYASTYSTGMKKKLALTALLLQQNQYFILDEPFNGLDIQSNMVLTEIMLQLKALNKIVLVSSHIFSTLRDTCDEIYLVRSGEPIRKVLPQEFDRLEAEMKATTIGSKISDLGLR